MNIDLTLLYNRNVDYIDISNTYNLPSDYISCDDIVGLGEVVVNGSVNLDDEENACINCTISGVMTLLDSISLEEVSYPYEINYDDVVNDECLDEENNLDIYEFLWENILLEKPLRFTKVNDYSKFRGEGWKLVQDDELKTDNNPFKDLLKEYEDKN